MPEVVDERVNASYLHGFRSLVKKEHRLIQSRLLYLGVGKTSLVELRGFELRVLLLVLRDDSNTCARYFHS